MLLIMLPIGLPSLVAPAIQDDPPMPLTIGSPAPGQALQGTVVITGTTMVEGFISSELAFTYANLPAGTWFIIERSDEPVSAGTLAEWDTSTLTDGDYRIRLVVDREAGESLVTSVEGLRVRNYTTIETNTPTPPPTVAPIQTTTTPAEVATRESTPTTGISTPTGIPPTGTPVPENPAQITTAEFTNSVFSGVATVLGGFLVIGFYLLVRGAFRR